jgi:hypothetical protein
MPARLPVMSLKLELSRLPAATCPADAAWPRLTSDVVAECHEVACIVPGGRMQTLHLS